VIEIRSPRAPDRRATVASVFVPARLRAARALQSIPA